MSSPLVNRNTRSGDLAFGVVILASLVMLVTSRVLENNLPLLVTAILLTLVYFGIGVMGYRWALKVWRPAVFAAYFAVLLALGGVVTFLGKSSTWLLLLPVGSLAVQYLPRRWSWPILAVIWVIELLPLILEFRSDVIYSAGFAYLAAIVFVAVFTQLVVSEQNARVELSRANQKLREYAAKAEDLATAQERNRLAREIHDGLGHYLTAINIQIRAAQAMNRQDPEQAATALANASDLAQEALADVRRSVTALRADPATNRPLADVLTGLVQECRATGLEAGLVVKGDPLPLSSQIEFTLFRVAQEGLTNVRKHAQATRVELLLDYSQCCKDAPGMVALRVRDNGQGSESPGSGFGLTGLQERVQLMGGRLDVQTAPGMGFTLCAEIPV